MYSNNNTMNYLQELDLICNSPVQPQMLSRANYKDHLDCHNYYNNTKTSKELACKERNYYYSFSITQGKCIIYQTQHMTSEEEYIVREAKTTETAIRQAVKEFNKRYSKFLNTNIERARNNFKEFIK